MNYLSTIKFSRRNILIWSLSIVIILVITEFMLRLALFAIGPRYIEILLAWHSAGHMATKTEAASYVRWRPNRQSQDLNTYGFHSPEILLDKSENILRLAFLGGSTTYNTGPIDETYPHFVNLHLQRNGLSTEFLNAAATGYTTIESLITYHIKVRPFNPDIVVLYNGRNDLFLSGNDLYRPLELIDLKRPPYFKPPPAFHRLMSQTSYLYTISMELLGINSLRDNNYGKKMRTNKRWRQQHGVVDTIDAYMENIRTKRVYDVYRHNLEALAVLTHNNGSGLLLVGFDFQPGKIRSVLLPADRSISPEEQKELAEMIRQLNNIMKETASNFANVLFFDLHGQIKPECFQDDCHLTKAGKNQKGNLIAAFLYQHLDELAYDIDSDPAGPNI